MTTNHTPTLWKADHISLSPRSAVYANTAEGQVVIAMCEEEGDAAFIVRCVNSHAALVEALDSLLIVIAETTKPYALPTECRKRIDSHTRLADSALKLARGEA